MKLLIDIGNSRIKWGVADETAVLLRSGIVGHEVKGLDQLIHGLNEQYAWQSVIVVSVSKENFYKVVQSVLFDATGIAVQRFLSQTQLLGVTNHYRKAAQLGADRWAAIIAAHKSYSGSLLVCDCGTATTFDLIDAVGNHQGGYILPGLTMARRVLATETAALPEVSGGDLMPADDTEAAIANGTLLQIIATIEYLLTHNNQPECILTGGNAVSIGAFLNYPFHHEPDLVLKGLAFSDIK